MRVLVLLSCLLLGTTSGIPYKEVEMRFNSEKIYFICQDIRCLVDSICRVLDVPYELVWQIGQNESGWRWLTGQDGDIGYLQVMPQTFEFWEKKLKLEGGHTELNNLIVGITYLRHQYDRYGSWRKARFSYARGSWREEWTWRPIERRFMGKIDWSKY